MATTLAIDDFLARCGGTAVVDVRTPAEFADGHIPGARNIPLFDDGERAAVGTVYKRTGREAAVELGLKMVGPKLAAHSAAMRIASGGQHTLLVYCWRGGMRSASMAWLAGLSGLRAHTLQGGYKAFRRWVLTPVPADAARTVHVLSGFTGSGKTAVLHALAARGAAVIDFEGLACHKGSVFGGLGEAPQPTQEQFENELMLAWRAIDPARPLWLEDESRTIGRCHLPAVIWDAMRAAQRYFLDVPLAERIARLCATYAAYPAATLATCIHGIRKRLGGDHAARALDALHTGDLDEVCRIVLRYYDRSYRTCLDRAVSPPVRTITATARDPEAIASSLHPTPR